MSNGIIITDNQISIADQLRHIILEHLHASHQCIKGTEKVALKTVFWTDMPKSVENINKHHNHSILMSDHCLLGSRLEHRF